MIERYGLYIIKRVTYIGIKIPIVVTNSNNHVVVYIIIIGMTLGYAQNSRNTVETVWCTYNTSIVYTQDLLIPTSLIA